MKIAFTVLHGNITNRNKKSVGNNEAINIAKQLRKYYEVDFLTCEECDDCIHIDENYNINQYDTLMVMNGSVNMFGGQEVKTATTIYKLLHKFDGQIYYLLSDLLMPFVDYYKHIQNKPFNVYQPDDFKLQRPLIILSQFKDIKNVSKLHKGIDCKVYYLPLSYWYLQVYEDDMIESLDTFNVKNKVDLIYGGSFRAGNRLKKMEDYFFNRNINVELYGNIKRSQFKGSYSTEPTFTGKVEPWNVIRKNSSSLATLIIGDKSYNDNTVTLRVIESLASNSLMFIDNDFDTKHEILNDLFGELEFCYVKNGDELEEKINTLKNNPRQLLELKSLQKDVLNEMKEVDLSKLIKEVIDENKGY